MSLTCSVLLIKHHLEKKCDDINGAINYHLRKNTCDGINGVIKHHLEKIQVMVLMM